MSDDKDLFLWSPNSSSLTAVELSVDSLFLATLTESVGTSKDSLSELLPSLSSDDSGEQIMQNTQIELILVNNSAVLCIQRISQVQFLTQQQNSTVTLICMCQCKYIMFSLSYSSEACQFQWIAQHCDKALSCHMSQAYSITSSYCCHWSLLFRGYSF